MDFTAHTVDEMTSRDREYWDQFRLLAGPRVGDLSFRHHRVNDHLSYRVAFARTPQDRWMALLTLSSRHPENKPLLLPATRSLEEAQSLAELTAAQLEARRLERTARQKLEFQAGSEGSLHPAPECRECGNLMTFQVGASGTWGKWECDCNQAEELKNAIWALVIFAVLVSLAILVC